MKKAKELFFYGIALLVIATCDLLMLVMDLRGGDFAMVTHEDPLTQAVTNGILIAILICISISILVGGYLGVKGILESRNPSGGRLHIVIARALAILNLVLTVIMGLALFNSTDLRGDIETFLLCMADLILMSCYAKAAKAVRNGAK